LPREGQQVQKKTFCNPAAIFDILSSLTNKS
jgi:hypothetical protein